ncbi:MAG: PEGA domain-containing protein [Myxococcaceae bacterium]
MSSRAALPLFAALSLLALPAGAQDDDILSPLPASPGKTKPRPPKRKPKTRPSPSRDDDDLLAPLTVQKTQLLVRVQGGVKGAKLFIDDREIATLPAGAVELSPGEHAVAVRRPGYSDYLRTISAKSGQTTELNAALEAVSGVVTITASISGAQVRVDGQSVGTTPVQELIISPGAHDILVSREGYADEASRLQVNAGRDYTVIANLKLSSDTPLRPEPPVAVSSIAPDSAPAPSPLVTQRTMTEDKPWHQRWYTWVGVGAAVAVTAVVVYVAIPACKEDCVCRLSNGKPCAGTISAIQSPAAVSF